MDNRLITKWYQDKAITKRVSQPQKLVNVVDVTLVDNQLFTPVVYRKPHYSKPVNHNKGNYIVWYKYGMAIDYDYNKVKSIALTNDEKVANYRLEYSQWQAMVNAAKTRLGYIPQWVYAKRPVMPKVLSDTIQKERREKKLVIRDVPKCYQSNDFSDFKVINLDNNNEVTQQRDYSKIKETKSIAGL